jgi:hypothetical protein
MTYARLVIPATFALLAAAAVHPGCGAEVDTGSCSVDADCPGRGEICDTFTSECVPESDTVPSEVGTTPSGAFTAIVPIHRGTLCVPTEVQGATFVPVTVNPCFHPCLSLQRFVKTFNFECFNSNCDAFVSAWYEVTGDACPSDAFGQFDRAQCVYPSAPITATLESESAGLPASGTMIVEVPYLSAADAAALDALSGSARASEFLRRAKSYIQDPGRTQVVQLRAEGPQPPPECTGPENCDCVDFGFE